MSPTELSTATDISVPYASQIISGKRPPSRALAIHIFRRTGLKFGPIAKLSEKDIDQLEKLEAKAA